MQLGRNIEDYELRMYIFKGLRIEFDQNVRVLETQREITINDIRYALKQEELRRNKRKEERTSRDEYVRKAREKSRSDITCYNCGMKGHTSSECRNKQKCYNCQGFNYIAADCKEPRRCTSRGRGFRANTRARARGRGRGQSEVTLKTADEAVLSANDKMHESTIRANEKNEQRINDNYKGCMWLLDSGATSHMASSKVFESLEEDKRDISLADKEGKKLISDGRGEVIIKQGSNNGKIRLKNVLCVPDINMNLLSVAKITDHGYSVKFDKYGAIVYRNEKEIEMTAVREENAYCEIVNSK